MRKWIPALLVTLALMTCLTGCTDLGHGIIKELEDNKDGIKAELEELKDGLIAEFNDWMGHASRYSITKEKDLKGRREFGADEYVGNYEAQYTRFNGKEYIFGGTLMERERGAALKVTYTLDIQSGTAALYWLGSPDDHILTGEKEVHMIAEVTSADVYEFTMTAGDNFIVLKGDDFTGKLSLRVE